MGTQKLFLHVGLPKSGSTYLQAILAQNRMRLKEHGYLYPWIRNEAMFHAGVEIREAHQSWGMTPEGIDGTWAHLLRRCRYMGGTAIISHEIFAGASPTQIARIAEDTADFDVSVIVTVRDVARQASAHWQEQVKNGVTDSFGEYSRKLLNAGPFGEGSSLFWNAQDVHATLQRWEGLVPPERLHVVVCPPPGGDPTELWNRFASVIDFDPSLVATDVARSSNASLGAAQVKLLREVITALDDRIPQPHYAHVVKRLFAQTLLSQVKSPTAVTPEYLRKPLQGLAEGWADVITQRGYPVHGDLAEMVPSTPVPGDAPDPDDIGGAAMAQGISDVIAALLLDIHRAEGTTRAQARTIHEMAKPLPVYPPAWRRRLSWAKGKATLRGLRSERLARRRRRQEFTELLPPETLDQE
ncbi:MAG: hypothetical protein L0H93_02810 [Nocardioides sp.]|nr:hypothetical protein [Nocardioides sp.]